MTTVESQTIKIRKTTLTKLRMLYALTGKPMYSIIDELVTAELEHTQKKCKKE